MVDQSCDIGMTPVASGSGCPGVDLTVGIRTCTLTWANEITYDIDGGHQVFGPFADNVNVEDTICLAAGQHTFNHFD